MRRRREGEQIRPGDHPCPTWTRPGRRFATTTCASRWRCCSPRLPDRLAHPKDDRGEERGWCLSSPRPAFPPGSLLAFARPALALADGLGDRPAAFLVHLARLAAQLLQ